MRIRDATHADVQRMHRIRMSVRENALSDAASVQPHHYRALFDSGGRGWVAEIDSEIVGFAMADVGRANVWALFVDPSFEGRGIGRSLHDAMLECLFSLGLERVWLTTSPGTRAQRFYLAAGWRAAGLEPNGEIRYEISRTSIETPA